MWFFSDAKSIFFKFLDVNDIMSCQNPPFKKTKKKKTSHALTHDDTKDGMAVSMQSNRLYHNPTPILLLH